MTEKPEQKNRELAGLARSLDQGEIKLESLHESLKLDKKDLDKIDRVHHALTFLTAIKSDMKSGKYAETIKLHETENSLLSKEEKPVVVRGNEDLPFVIDRFKIKKLVGLGGFARVFLAFDPQLRRNVAIKVLRSTHVFSNEAAARFEREARAAAILSHPNIIPVFETGTIETDRYIVSEYCDGITVEEWIENAGKKFDFTLAATIVATISEATAHAHQRGVFHRDLKPANVMLDLAEADSIESLSQEDIASRIRITDFGLAKYAEPTDNLQTTESAIVGTPAYMSPEQAASSKEITSSTDIYSIGVILYELLTGQLPIFRDTHIDTLIAVKRDEPVPPRQLNSAIPRDLQAICMKCLQKAPADRYASAFDLAEDLCRWKRGDPVQARHVSALERFGKWCRRNPEFTVAGALVFSGLIFCLIQWNQALQSAHGEKLAAARARRSTQLSQATVSDMVNDISLSSSIPPEFARSLVERAVDLQTQLLEENPSDKAIRLETARVWKQLSVSEYNLRDFEAGLRACDHALEILDAFSEAEQDLQHQMTRNQLVLQKAKILSSMGETARAMELIGETEFGSDNLIQASNKYIESGRAKSNEGDWQSAWNEFEKGLIIMTSLDIEENSFASLIARSDTATLQYLQGVAELNLGRLYEAETSLANSIAIIEEVTPLMPYHESMLEMLANSYSDLGRVQTELEKFDSAIESQQTAINAFKMLHDRNNTVDRYFTKSFRARLYLAESYLKAESFSDASESLKKLESGMNSIPANTNERQDFSVQLRELQLQLTDNYQNDPDRELDATVPGRSRRKP